MQHLTNKGDVFLFDEEDILIILGRKWSLNNSGYVSAAGGLLHRQIMRPEEGFEVDHINGDKLDNRRTNLRCVTHSQNHFNMPHRPDNTSGVKGVVWHRENRRWQAQIGLRGRCIYLGNTLDFFEAVCLRKSAEVKYHV